MKTLILIDGNGLIHRSYYALPRLTTKKGELVNVVYGFTSILFKVIKDLEPDYLTVAFDLAGPTFREKKYKKYKAKRVKAPQEMYDQISWVKKVLRVFDIPIYEKKGFEADDVIGTIVSKLKSRKPRVKTIIITGDLDMLQLIGKQTKVQFIRRGITDTIIYDQQAVNNRYGLSPKQITDLKGLKGDPSDNIPGVPGIGEKTAIDLIKEFGTLKKLYQTIQKNSLNPKLKARLLEYKEQAFLSQDLATIKNDVPVDFDLAKCRWGKYNQKKITKLLKRLNFYTLIKRLPVIK